MIVSFSKNYILNMKQQDYNTQILSFMSIESRLCSFFSIEKGSQVLAKAPPDNGGI